MSKRELLRGMSFGHRVAEDETDELATYFVETDIWSRLFRGDIDVVYGSKGAGKSALYSLLLSRDSELFDRNIILMPAENPRGAPAFRGLLTSPPASEREFNALWKLYFASLLHAALQDYGIRDDAAHQLEQALVREGLVKGALTLAGLLGTVSAYVKRALNPQALQGEIKIDPVTGMPNGFGGKIIFSEPKEGDPELRSVDRLLALANDALAASGRSAWILLDRLDVAFSDVEELEINALRALFRVYLDLLAFQHIKLKIFLRSDIWARITEDGFREASHITRHVTIGWTRTSLLNLLIRRALHNPGVLERYNVSSALSNSSSKDQEQFLYRLCPDQVDVGPNKSTTLDWLLSRTRDGTQLNAPRELIHFMNCLREFQVSRLEVGEPEPEGEQIFVRAAFKEALPEVSKVRLEQTLYSEHPEIKDWIERLRGEKTLQTSETLAGIWSISTEEALIRAAKLKNIGFFEERGSKQAPSYWVPFLYRDALGLVQGAAD